MVFKLLLLDYSRAPNSMKEKNIGYTNGARSQKTGFLANAKPHN